jgi:hypothetical protein
MLLCDARIGDQRRDNASVECDADSVCFFHAAAPGACFAAFVRVTASASHEAIATLEVDRGLGQQQQAEWGGLCRILPAQSAPLPWLNKVQTGVHAHQLRGRTEGYEETRLRV